MVTTICADGMSGEARAYVSVVALLCTHFPATVGVSTGAAWRSDTGAEKVSEIVVFAATFCAPAAGLVDCRENEAPLEPPDPLDPSEPVLDPLTLDASLAEPDRGVEEPNVSTSTTTTTTATAAPSSMTHGRRRSGLPALDS